MHKYKHGSIITTDNGVHLEVVEETKGSCEGCYFIEKYSTFCRIGGEVIPCLDNNFILKVPDTCSISSEALEYEEDHRVC